MTNQDPKTLSPSALLKRAYQPVELVRLKDVRNKLIEGYRGVYNKTQKKVISCVSDQYQLLPNSEIIKPILAHLNKKKIEYRFDRFSYVNDQRMRLHITLPKQIIKDDSKQGCVASIFLHNSYNFTESFSLIAGMLRQVCSNGMVVGQILHQIRMKHRRKDLEQSAVAHMEAVLKDFHDNKDAIQARIQQLIKQKTDLDMLKDVLSKFDARTGKYVLVSLGLMDEDAPSTELAEYANELKTSDVKIKMYALYNILTQYITHKGVKRYQINQLNKVSKMFDL